MTSGADQLHTDFLPAERASASELQQQVDALRDFDVAQPLFKVLPEVVWLLNRERQIVYSVNGLDAELGASPAWLSAHLGDRTGEAFDCCHARESAGGCGTTCFCRVCGAAQAIARAGAGHASAGECRITRRNGDALDLRVWAVPMRREDQQFVIFAIQDISAEKRRQVLERTFFHDISNSLQAALGYAGLLQLEERLDCVPRYASEIAGLLDQIRGEIEDQRCVVSAEQGDLVPKRALVEPAALLTEVRQYLQRHPSGEGHAITLDVSAAPLALESDPVLLRRVLVNMGRNALEASPDAAAVHLAVSGDGDQVRFSVHNHGHMAAEDALRVFQRNFSTKGAGRGLGTYSMKLLATRYLGGDVSFTSAPGHGTTFTLRVPRVLPEGPTPE